MNENKIAERVAKRLVAGFTFALERCLLEITGWQPVNVDVLREIRSFYFPFVDDDGIEHDDGRFGISDVKRMTRPLTYYEEKAMKERGEAPVTVITGRIPARSREGASGITCLLKRKFGLDARLK